MGVDVKMFIRLRYTLDDAELEVLRSQYVEAFALEKEAFFFMQPLPRLKKGDCDWDFIPLSAHESEDDCWLDVNLSTSVYEFGYERGDLPLFVQSAEWFEAKLPDCEVWYGNDAAAEHSAERWDKAKRDRLMRYFEKVGWEPYLTKDPEVRKRLRELWEN